MIPTKRENMKQALLLAAVAAALAGCAPGVYVDPVTNLRNSAFQQAEAHGRSVSQFLAGGGTNDQAIAKAQQAVAGSLKDPDSAKFRNVAVKDFGSLKVVCGEVNGKNSYGGYVGFKRFVSGINSGTIESTGSRYPDIDMAANYGLTSACG